MTVYYKYTVPEWDGKDMVVSGKTEADCRHNAKVGKRQPNIQGWQQVSYQEYTDIIATW